jgi:rubrerythrin
MTGEQERVLEAINLAIQMEADGKEYYEKASKQCNNKLGKELFAGLADAEDKHGEKFTSIYHAIKEKNNWPDVTLEAGAGRKIRDAFSTTAKGNICQADEITGQLDAIDKAMKKEDQSREYYKNLSAKAAFSSEKAFYEALVNEENTHYLALVDYREYLTDPSGYFVLHEHHSMDGG